MKNVMNVKGILAFLLAAIFLWNCNASRTTKGGAIGAGTGAVIGGIIGKKTGSTAGGAIIGAAVGGAAGAVIGRYMDKQAKEIEENVDGAVVERVGEGIRVKFDSGILFGFDKDQLNAESERNLAKMAEVLKKYEDTEILIEGHTDNKGDANYNQKLSVRRAKEVEKRLKEIGVQNNRLTTKGYGFDQPIASNDTETGRQENRRVEVIIVANDELKEKAEQGKVDDL
ncbi:OmpA family protein [Rhodocytophaga rosea]|uniref:OmpA family protein n=1 Tax=Rhodocytophaga rosea TaxID=2704465 RepID=A0A6C0GKD6_9BACT|nr:OmpA family protein [Rhodocytophaga rosea]QHT68496.1 OmpA family protein [Rhodocytophaga rosea]